MHLNLRLKLLKAAVNMPMRLLDKLLPERAATFPQTKILDAMYRRMFQAYRLEQAQGIFQEIGNFYGDGNFERLLQVSRKLLIAIGEDDRYYREWLGLLVILAHEEYEMWLAQLTPEQLKFWCRAQWFVSPDCLSDEAVLEVKDRLAPDVLAYYLHLLARKP